MMPYLVAAILVLAVASSIYFNRQAAQSSANAAKSAQIALQEVQRGNQAATRHHGETAAQNRTIANQNKVIIAQNAEIEALLNAHTGNFTQTAAQLSAICSALHIVC
jgi:cell shape-determining protein MreC